MKTALISSFVLGIVLMFVAFLFGLMHWQGADVAATGGLVGGLLTGASAVTMFLLLFWQNYKSRP